MCFDVGGTSGKGADAGSSKSDDKPKASSTRTKADVQKEINKKIKAATDSSGNVDWKKADVGSLVKERESFSTTSTESTTTVVSTKDDKPAKKTTTASKTQTDDSKTKRATALAAKKEKVKSGTVAEGKGTGDYKTIGDVLEDPAGFLKDTGKKLVDNITTDVTMGLKTFGLNKEEQAEKLRELGYSEKSIISYQERTEASKKRINETMEKLRNEDSPEEAAAKKVGAIEPTTTPTTTTTTSTTGTEREEDIGGAGDTSVTAEDIMTQDPEAALSEQERLARRELRTQRQRRALAKAQQLRARVESQGGGRRSLMRGSLGGAGFRSGY